MVEVLVVSRTSLDPASADDQHRALLFCQRLLQQEFPSGRIFASHVISYCATRCVAYDGHWH